MKRWMTLSIVFALMMTFPLPAASGGGATFDFGSDYLVAGDRVTGRTSVWLGAKRSGRLEDGPYHAYLVPLNARYPEVGLPEGARWLAPISFEPLPGPYATARVSFEVPAVPSAGYSVMVCNVPCTVQSVGDLIGGWFTIAASPTEARIQSLTDRLDWKTDALRRQMNGEERRAEKAEEALRAEITGLRRELDALREASRTRRRPPETTAPGWLGWAGWGGVVLLALALTFRRRRKVEPPPPGPEVEWIIPEERVPERT